MDEYAESLYITNPLREPVIRSAIRALHFPKGSRGLDAGCGIGLQAVILAEVVGHDGHVTGLDLSPDFVTLAERISREKGLSERISFQEGDIKSLPINDNSFDWAWSMDCVGYHPSDQLTMLKELVRVVKPGGTVAILAWSSEQLLPGYPLLEARLKATTHAVAPFVQGMKPEIHFLRALSWFRELGLKESEARTFVGSTFAPLSNEQRKALIAFFKMRWIDVETELSKEDFAEFQRLTQIESADFILNHPDYYAFFTYSLFHGRVDK